MVPEKLYYWQTHLATSIFAAFSMYVIFLCTRTLPLQSNDGAEVNAEDNYG